MEVTEIMVGKNMSFSETVGFPCDKNHMLWVLYGFVIPHLERILSRNRAASQTVPLQSEALQARQVKSQASHGAEVCDD